MDKFIERIDREIFLKIAKAYKERFGVDDDWQIQSAYIYYLREGKYPAWMSK